MSMAFTGGCARALTGHCRSLLRALLVRLSGVSRPGQVVLEGVGAPRFPGDDLVVQFRVR